MRIVVDALGISVPGGGRTATLVWLEGLLRHDPVTRYTILLDQVEPALIGLSPNARFVTFGHRQRFLARIMLQCVIPWYAARSDIIHYAKNLACATPFAKTIITVYDLSAVTLADLYPLSDRFYWRHVQPLALGLSSRVIAISQFTADEIVGTYGVDPEKVRVICPACDARYTPVATNQTAAVLNRHALSGPYVLHVGAISRKKNVSTLIKAFAGVVARGYAGFLVLVGGTYSKLSQESLRVVAHQNGVTERLIALGEVPEDEMPALYTGADAFVMPSLCEGFGLAALEAISCGAPTIVSGNSGMAEVVASSGLLLDNPTDDVALTGLMARVLFDQSFAGDLRVAGIARSRTFSAEKSAIQTMELYRTIVRETPDERRR